MSIELPAITKSIDHDGVVQYHFWADQTWDGFDSLVGYLRKYWNASIVDSVDEVYSRRWMLQLGSTNVTVFHDSQEGNRFRSDNGHQAEVLMNDIEADLLRRFHQSSLDK
jgi:hypothetical protein